MADLDTLRPEVRAAMEAMDADVQTREWLCIRAELLRLAMIETDALIALDCEHDWQAEHERAEKAEAELAATTEATRLERARCLQAVADEAELPGEMPDEMWDYLDGDRDAMQMALRMAVRQTKEGIRERINAV